MYCLTTNTHTDHTDQFLPFSAGTTPHRIPPAVLCGGAPLRETGRGPNSDVTANTDCTPHRGDCVYARAPIADPRRPACDPSRAASRAPARPRTGRGGGGGEGGAGRHPPRPRWAGVPTTLPHFPAALPTRARPPPPPFPPSAAAAAGRMHVALAACAWCWPNARGAGSSPRRLGQAVGNCRPPPSGWRRRPSGGGDHPPGGRRGVGGWWWGGGGGLWRVAWRGDG